MAKAGPAPGRKTAAKIVIERLDRARHRYALLPAGYSERSLLRRPLRRRPTASGPSQHHVQRAGGLPILARRTRPGPPGKPCGLLRGFLAPAASTTLRRLSQGLRPTTRRWLAIAGRCRFAYVQPATPATLHDIPEPQLCIMQRLTKWSASIRAPHEAALDHTTREFPADGLRARPRPAAIECPLDVWGKATGIALPGMPASAVRGPNPNDEPS